jgi:hypothetical protein
MTLRFHPSVRRPLRPHRLRVVVPALAAAVCAVPANAQRENPRPLEVQVGVLASTGALGTAEGYSVRLQAAPTIALAWHQAAASGRMHARAVVEATPYLWGRVAPTAGCVGYCRPAGFTIMGASLGADVVLAANRAAAVAPYVALGARGRAYFLASGDCATVVGAFCPGGDPLTDPTIRPALAVAAGTHLRSGTTGLAIEVGYLPTWVRHGRMQHDLRATFGMRL